MPVDYASASPTEKRGNPGDAMIAENRGISTMDGRDTLGTDNDNGG